MVLLTSSRSPRRFVSLTWILVLVVIISILGISFLYTSAQENRLPFIIGSGDFSHTDGIYYEAEFRFPYGIAVDEKKNLMYIVDMQNHRIRQLNLETYEVSTLAGSSEQFDRFGFPGGGHRDGDAEKAMFNRPRGIAIAPNGALYIADTGNHAIRMYYEGMVYTVAGNGTSGYKNDKGIEAQFHNPSSIAIGPDGFLYVSDTLNHVIRKIDNEGNVTTFIGNKEDTSLLFEPAGISFDKNGVLHIADSANQQIKRVVNGTLEVVAGFADTKDPETEYWIGGFENGIKKDARFNFPKGIAFGDNGLLFVADSFNHTIRAITPTGKVYTIAGTGISGTSWDEQAVVRFDGPIGITYAMATLFVSDYWNNRIIAIPMTPEYLRSVIDYSKKRSSLPVFIDGVELSFPDVQPFIIDGSTKVPVRFIAEALGAEVSWDSINRAVVVKRNGQTVIFRESEGEFFIKDSRSMVGLRVLAEKLGYFVDWNATERAVIIETFGG